MRIRSKYVHLTKFVLTALSVSVAGFLTSVGRPLFGGKSPLLFFVIAILIASGYGGTIQGLFATALSFGIALSLFNDHRLELLTQSGLTLLAGAGVAVSLVLGKLRQTNEALAQTRDELKRANEILAEQTRQLAQRNIELEQFVYAASHDLQEPLRVVSTFSDAMVTHYKGNLGQQADRYIEYVAVAVARMNAMIQGLLAYSGVLGAEESSFPQISLDEVVQQATRNLKVAIEDAQARITQEPLPTVPGERDQLVSLFKT